MPNRAGKRMQAAIEGSEMTMTITNIRYGFIRGSIPRASAGSWFMAAVMLAGAIKIVVSLWQIN